MRRIGHVLVGAMLIAFATGSALHASPAQAQSWGYPDGGQRQGDGWHGGWHRGWHDGWRRPDWGWHRPHPWRAHFYAPPPYYRYSAPPPPPYYGGGY
jgi:hypothetical protein